MEAEEEEAVVVVEALGSASKFPFDAAADGNINVLSLDAAADKGVIF